MLFFPVLLYCQGNNNYQVIRQNIAETYGLKKFYTVKTIRFTFNVNLKGKHIKRTWSWEPKTNNVSYKGNDPNGKLIDYKYNRKNMEKSQDELTRQIDKWFVNDQYWLLFPLHIEWDKNIKIIKQDKSQSPIEHSNMNRIVIKYPANIGYTPGDVFEVFYDNNFLIKEWIYRAGGSKDPTRLTNWTKYSTVGPLLISLEHGGKDNFKQWFVDVSVQLDDNTWHNAKVIN